MKSHIRSSDEEHIKHISTLTVGCTIFLGKGKRTCIVFLNGAPTHKNSMDRGSSNFRNVGED